MTWELKAICLTMQEHRGNCGYLLSCWQRLSHGARPKLQQMMPLPQHHHHLQAQNLHSAKAGSVDSTLHGRLGKGIYSPKEGRAIWANSVTAGLQQRLSLSLVIVQVHGACLPLSPQVQTMLV